jgi:hypothetical protein
MAVTMALTSRLVPRPGELIVPPELEVVPLELPLDELLDPPVAVFNELINDDKLLVVDDVALVMD